MAVDAIVFAISPFIALYLRMDEIVGSSYLDSILHYLPAVLVVQSVAFLAFNLYRRVWKYAGIHELMSIVGAVALGQLSLFLLATCTVWMLSLPLAVEMFS